MKTSNMFFLPSASLYYSAPPFKRTTRYSMGREILMMDDEEWQSFKLAPFSHWSKVIKDWQSLQLPIFFRSNQQETHQEITFSVEVAKTLAFPRLKLNTAKLKVLGSAIEIHHISAYFMCSGTPPPRNTAEPAALPFPFSKTQFQQLVALSSMR
eukprot:15366098-Ditylum_brightwellii.AAC.1